MTAPAPTVCNGWGVVIDGIPATGSVIDELTRSLNLSPLRVGENYAMPCPGCRCQVCGRLTDSPPECEDCFSAEESAAKRRSDR